MKTTVVNSTLNKLNANDVGLNLDKCEFLLPDINWLGFALSAEGATPLSHKLDSIRNLQAPTTRKQLRGLMGAAHQLIKFFPHLAQICTPFRPGLKTSEKFVWTPEMQLALTRLKRAVMHVTQNKFFDSRAETRITCDASKDRLGAVLEQRLNCSWVPFAFASRFLNETTYSINELELLAVVWSIENFESYVYGRHITFCTDLAPYSVL